MSLDKIKETLEELDLVSWARTIPPEHRIILLIVAWSMMEIADRKIYDSLVGELGVDTEDKIFGYFETCEQLGVDAQVLAAALNAIVLKFGKQLQIKDRS